MDKQKQLLIDKYTRMDKLMERIIPMLDRINSGDITVNMPEGPEDDMSIKDLLELLKYQHKKNYEIHFFTYPDTGAVATLGIGDTILDFRAGTIKSSAGVVTKMSNSLMKLQIDFLRSLAINADEGIIVQLDAKDKIRVKADNWFIGTYQQFSKITITTTVATELFVVACTSPEASIDMLGEANVSKSNVSIRTASGDLTAGETTTAVTGLGIYATAAIRLDVTKITTPDGDDEVDFYIQTSYDEGSNWVDLEAIHFATADNGNTATKIIMITKPQSSAVARAETDGTLADDTKLDLPLGDRIRIKTKVTGASAPTYAYNCVASFMV